MPSAISLLTKQSWPAKIEWIVCKERRRTIRRMRIRRRTIRKMGKVVPGAEERKERRRARGSWGEALGKREVERRCRESTRKLSQLVEMRKLNKRSSPLSTLNASGHNQLSLLNLRSCSTTSMLRATTITVDKRPRT